MRVEIQRYVSLWQQRCYSELPGEAPREIDDMVPSYRRVVMAIVRGDLTMIGASPPRSDYYGILKSIELNTTYIKSKRMTQQELRQSVFKLIDTLISKGCYIKGYGSLYRVVDSNHSPVKNITKAEMDLLLFNNIVVRSGLTWSLNTMANPFTHPIDVKMPQKQE